MKALLFALLALIIIFVLAQSFVMKLSNGIETYPYKVLQEYDEFEIRQYEAANFSYVTMQANNHKERSSSGFRTLAGYIFGSNANNEKIAMTSPVAMPLNDSISMMFMVPAQYDLDDLPKPNNSLVQFKQEPAKTVAAIRFSGWANDDKIAFYTNKLTQLLAAQNIAHLSDFSYLGYNPPYEVLNRRNEIIVSIQTEK